MQITEKGVRLLSCDEQRCVAEWKPTDGRHISVATCNHSQILLAVGGALYYLEVEQGRLEEILWHINSKGLFTDKQQLDKNFNVSVCRRFS